jgi:hypothetical protein
MIVKNGKEVIAIYRKQREYLEIYHGKLLVWQIARSCFGSGYWKNDKPWINTDCWKNN